MAKKKRTTLPKDFENLMRQGAALSTLKQVFEKCEIDARDSSQQTALIMPSCSDELARWLVSQGADVKAVDRYGNNALHLAAGQRWKPRNPVLLIEFGCDVNARRKSSGDTPLHAAANGKNLPVLGCLIAAGAQVDAVNLEGLTPLELSLRGCANIDIGDMVLVARALLNAGARKTPAMRDFVRRIGKTFEFYRPSFAKDSVEATSAALLGLCELFGVEPPPRREEHDGKAPIKVEAGPWQRQFDQLWEALVPAHGAAATVQGEVIRISGRISSELYRNGGANWDSNYSKMARSFLIYVSGGQPIDTEDLQEAKAILDQMVKRKGNGNHAHERISELAVEWVRRNPKPGKLVEVPYKI